ncbi:hypothetical protein SPRG_03343 [Saprolegnia parasitica CBS 223.65]|uniref:Uncharacterized protein n=1 Tax=Saprolegnia parasitica (strain CBS 223.65) TaxID=695850 RepID=A0A067D050_SAPPC|nr:hypothetical protein SPRG_03343 [Saprolegnia parasitica CBS 223.65]KDO32126.1 hypothetical protein SPRG_03343 [Saprolegnia parasitica CBS 223.65]|eukprot:XP_012197310.1 hypothetical protein SPRG_03343 [Saprolegnia parasitica CBS 223.65]
MSGRPSRAATGAGTAPRQPTARTRRTTCASEARSSSLTRPTVASQARIVTKATLPGQATKRPITLKGSTAGRVQLKPAARKPAPPMKRALTIPKSPNFATSKRPPRTKPEPVPPPPAKPVQRRPHPPMKRRLTIPKSPDFATSHRPPRAREQKVSATTKELQDIANERRAMMLERRRFQRYHRATQGLPTKTPTQGPTFAMKLRSAGVLGVPAVRRPKLTQVHEFRFQTDKENAADLPPNKRRKFR